MMRRAKWTTRHRACRGIEDAGHRMHRRDLYRFSVGEGGENRRQSSREHRLACAWRTDQDDPMRSCRGDGERTLRALLSRDV
jgi:hypothetical protein